MPITSLSKLLGHAQVSTTQLYTAGADPALAAAYRTAMERLSTTAPAPGLASPPAASAPAASPSEPVPAPDLSQWGQNLPSVLRSACLAYVQHCVPRWQTPRLRRRARSLRWRLQHFFAWRLAQHPLGSLAEVSLADLRRFQQAELARGLAPHSINPLTAAVVGLLRNQADQEQPVDLSVFRLRPLPRPESLPRHLSEADSQRLESFVRQRLSSGDRQLALENACYFILAHGGLRACECLELQGQDLDLPAQRLRVRQGKGDRDRTVYLTDLACQALTHYLQLAPGAASAPLLRKADGTSLSHPWLHRHLHALGEAAGVPQLCPHRLRHTYATRLLNAGMPITSVQKLLGHAYLSTTQIYARVYDVTVEADYRRAMAQTERQHPPLSDRPLPVDNWPTPNTAAAASAAHARRV